MNKAAFNLTDRSVSNLAGVFYGTVIGIILAIALFNLYKYIFSIDILRWFNSFGIDLIIVWLFGTMLVHELLHGLVWKLLNLKNSGLKIKFGYSWKVFAFYARAIGVMPIQSYLYGVAAPGVIFGFLPVILGSIYGSNYFMIFGFLNLLGSGGDFFIFWLARKEPKTCWVQDHTTRLGFLVVAPENSTASRQGSTAQSFP